MLNKNNSIFIKLILSIAISLLVFTSVPVLTSDMQYSYVVEAASIKINKTKYTMYKGDTYTLKITGTNKKVTWSSSNKKIATVNSKGKVTAKKKGTATITAKVGSKKYKCKITVKNSQTVYITKTGKKYHKSSCSYLRQSKIAISLSKAKSRGYTACKRCNP